MWFTFGLEEIQDVVSVLKILQPSVKQIKGFVRRVKYDDVKTASCSWIELLLLLYTLTFQSIYAVSCYKSYHHVAQ